VSTTQLAMDKLMQAQALLGEARQYEQNAGHEDRAKAISVLMVETSAVANVVINTEVEPRMSPSKRAAVDLLRSGSERLRRLRESRGEVSS
jgi:hypothetical protein